MSCLLACIKVNVTLTFGSNISGVHDYEPFLRDFRIVLCNNEHNSMSTSKDYKGGVSLIKEEIEIRTDTADDAVDYVAYVAAVAQAILASIKKRCIIFKLLLCYVT